MNDLLPSLHGQLDQVLQGIQFFLPEIYLSVLFVIVLVTDLLFKRNSAQMCRLITFIGLVLVIFKDLAQFKLVVSGQNYLFFNQMLQIYPRVLIFKLLIDILVLILVLYFEEDDELRSQKKGFSNLFSITVAAIFGLHLMVMASNLLSIYLSVEMVSIASYL